MKVCTADGLKPYYKEKCVYENKDYELDCSVHTEKTYKKCKYRVDYDGRKVLLDPTLVKEALKLINKINKTKFDLLDFSLFPKYKKMSNEDIENWKYIGLSNKCFIENMLLGKGWSKNKNEPPETK